MDHRLRALRRAVTMMPSSAQRPDRVAVVGAGMVGLSTAWFLQEHGVEVTVLDRTGVAAGASWGNAGWLTPGLTGPLPEPSVLRYGLRTALKPSSPVFVPLRPNLRLWRFLSGFARHCTTSRWAAGMQAYAPLNERSLAAFDHLTDTAGLPRTTQAQPFLACFRDEAAREALLEELEHLRAAGQPLSYEAISGQQARHLEPSLSQDVGAAIRLHEQRYINPPSYVAALAASVRARGATITAGADITSVSSDGPGVVLVDADGGRHRFGGVVLATGAELGTLARPAGVRRLVQAGRGYSFSVTGTSVPTDPVYFPAQRVACTPLHGGSDEQPTLRVAGMMEFRAPGDPLDPRRVRAVVEAVRPFLPGVDLDDRRDEWVGSRPCTTDGLPLIGATSVPHVYAAGGHGMWGIVLGPLTGQLLAENIVTGRRPELLAPFDPLR